jgi:acyl-CoA synthetase (NDP forming)
MPLLLSTEGNKILVSIDSPKPTPLSSQQLDHLLRPRSVALIGASDKNLFSRRAFEQHQRVSRGGEIVLVNPRSSVVHGHATVPTCADVPGGVECVYMVTPQSVTADALVEAAAAGARTAVIVSQGWAEEGGEGVTMQRDLVKLAQDLGMVLLGPNHLGFANLRDRVAATALSLDMPIEPGNLALVSQSGAVGSSLMQYAARNDVRFSFVVTTGNEAMVSVSDVVSYLVDDPDTRAIAIFAETIRSPEVFLDACRRAADAGKALVMLKVGSSELAARTAAAHTGALVGDDRVIDAMLRQHGVIRVRSVEDLIMTGVLAASTGPLRAGGLGLLSVSGGGCDLVADRADDLGLTLPPLSPASVERLRPVLPPYAHPQNPLDVTGGAVTRPEVFREGILALADEPDVGLVGVITSLPTSGEPQRAMAFGVVADTMREVGIPGVILPQADQAQDDHIREVKRETGVELVLPGLERFVVAAAGVSRWSTWLRSRSATAIAAVERRALPGSQTLSEHEARQLLVDAGVPVVPATLARTADEAVEAGRTHGDRLVLKMCSSAVSHKTELGGVILDVPASGAAEAYETLVARAAASGVDLEGILVSPMRAGGVELLVGVTRDESWGPVLAVAIGGTLVELLDDSALRLLPVSHEQVREMIGELRAAPLLTGYRGSKGVDLELVADAIMRIADLALSLGDQVVALEVNPLLVGPEGVEALDVLISRS